MKHFCEEIHFKFRFERRLVCRVDDGVRSDRHLYDNKTPVTLASLNYS